MFRSSARISALFSILPVLMSRLMALPAGASPPVPHHADPDWGVCRQAVREVERVNPIPHHLLGTIARIESGRREPSSGEMTPWPWTINAEGQGRFLPNKAAAIATIRSLQGRGVRSIDVGCMQINLMHHPNAFVSLEDALEPLNNVRYAASFLLQLNSTRNNWVQSASNYHSNTSDLATAYQQRILATWPEEARRAAGETPTQSTRRWMPAVELGQLASSGGRTFRAIRPVGQGTANGRDLNSYRLFPVVSAPTRTPPETYWRGVR